MPRSRPLLLSSLILLPLCAFSPAGAAPGREERPVASTSPITSVVESVVSLRVPLPGSAGVHPRACDRLSYLRWRHKDGPAKSQRADRVLIAQPGIFEGASAFDSVARNTVQAAARRGRHIEFWALDRRSNCLEDHTGRLAGLKSADVHTAVDYYYNRKAVNGRKFKGFRVGADVLFLQNIGLAQTLKDQYDLMRRELPDAGFRRSKTYCGGHSLGGLLTGFLATWDFDGDKATTADAGFNQCAGYFALDSVVKAGAPSPVGGEVQPSGMFLRDKDLLPYLGFPALINPETMNALGLAGLAARNAPNAESDLQRVLPANFNLDTTLRLLFAKDAAAFLTRRPDPRELRLTNAAALGALLDNNSMPLSFLQTATGFFSGGPIVEKNFPLPNSLLAVPELGFLRNITGSAPKYVPEKVGPLYGWKANNEVTDIRQLARSFAEAPLDFTEWYFPTKLATDLYQSDAEAIRAHTLHPDGITRRPVLTVQGGAGISLTPPVGNVVKAPGYHHLDVLTAAPRKNEPVSTALVLFIR